MNIKDIFNKIKKFMKEKDISILVYPTSTKRVNFKIEKKF
jgi:hypothetical protein